MDEKDRLNYVGMLMSAEKNAGEIDGMLDTATALAMGSDLGEDVAMAAEELKAAIHKYQAAVSRWFFANIETLEED